MGSNINITWFLPQTVYMWQTIWQRFENFKRILKEHRRIRYADIIQRRSKVNINEADLSAIRGEWIR